MRRNKRPKYGMWSGTATKGMNIYLNFKIVIELRTKPFFHYTSECWGSFNEIVSIGLWIWRQPNIIPIFFIQICFLFPGTELKRKFMQPGVLWICGSIPTSYSRLDACPGSPFREFHKPKIWTILSDISDFFVMNRWMMIKILWKIFLPQTMASHRRGIAKIFWGRVRVPRIGPPGNWSLDHQQGCTFGQERGQGRRLQVAFGTKKRIG